MSLDGQGRLAAQGSRALDGKLCTGCAQTSWVKDDGISTIGIALQEEVPSHL